MKFLVEIDCNPTVHHEVLAERLKSLIDYHFPTEYEENFFTNDPPIKVRILPTAKGKKK